jgi:hypothetical protein
MSSIDRHEKIDEGRGPTPMIRGRQPNYSLMTPGDEIPDAFALLFGPPPVLENENVRQYWALCRAFKADIMPTNALEWCWLRDTTDLTWEVRRYRKFKVAIISSAGRAARGTTLEPVKSNVHHSNISDEARNELIAASAEREANLAIAAGFASRLGEFDCIERLLASAESRRNATIREIELHRRIVALRVRETSDKFFAIEKHSVGAP